LVQLTGKNAAPNRDFTLEMRQSTPKITPISPIAWDFYPSGGIFIAHCGIQMTVSWDEVIPFAPEVGFRWDFPLLTRDFTRAYWDAAGHRWD
jgi:hypothetical protein